MKSRIKPWPHKVTYASDEDIEILRKHFTDDDFKATLDDPQTGFSTEAPGPNGMKGYNRTPVPPLPR